MERIEHHRHSGLPRDLTKALTAHRESNTGKHVIAAIARRQLKDLTNRWTIPTIAVAAIGTLVGAAGVFGCATTPMSLQGRLKWLGIGGVTWVACLVPAFLLDRRQIALREIAGNSPLYSRREIDVWIKRCLPQPGTVNRTPADYENGRLNRRAGDEAAFESWTKKVRDSELGYVTLTDGEIEALGSPDRPFELEAIPNESNTVTAHLLIRHYQRALRQRNWNILIALGTLASTASLIRITPTKVLRIVSGLTGITVALRHAWRAHCESNLVHRLTTKHPYVRDQNPAWLQTIGLEHGHDYIIEQSYRRLRD